MREATVVWETSPVRPVPHEKALPLLREAVKVAPNRADLRLNLAVALLKTDRMAELVEWLRPAIDDETAAPELLICLGDAALAVRDCQLALAAQQSAAAKGLVPAFGRMTETLARLGRPAEALAMGLEALERLPTDAKTFAIVARLLLDRGETERLWAGEPTRANKDALRSIVQLEQDTTQPRFRYSPGTPGRTAMPDTHDDETQGPEAPQAPARRPWHAPQFYLTEVASTYAQGGTIPDGSTTNGT